MGVQIPHVKGHFERGKGRPTVKYRDTLRSSMAEPIEMPFGLRTRVGPRNHVLDGVQIPIGRGNFGEKKNSV